MNSNRAPEPHAVLGEDGDPHFLVTPQEMILADAIFVFDVRYQVHASSAMSRDQH